MTRRAVTAVFVLLTGGVGCGSLLGIDDFEAVECVGDCAVEGGAEGGRPSEAGSPVDGSAVVDAGAEAAPPVDASACPGLGEACPSGNRLVVTFVAPPDSGTVTSDPAGIGIAAGETDSDCFGGGRVRLFPSRGRATFAGITCEDGNTNVERCELVGFNGPTCVVVTPP